MQDKNQLMARYQQLRQAGMKVAHTLVSRLSKEDMHEGARRLGILKNDILVFDDENEMPVLMDYCIHEVRRDGLNTIDRMFAEAPYPPGSDEEITLEALKNDYFSCFVVESLEPDVGIHVRDLVRDESLLIHDVNFSRSGQPGLMFAARVTAPDNILMTTGTALPVGFLPKHAGPEVEEGLQAVKSMLGGAKDRSQERVSEGIAALIRMCLEQGVMSNVVYEDSPGTSRPGSRPTFTRKDALESRPPILRPASSGKLPAHAHKPPTGVGVYDPCPCGSGKKFKFCCGARR